MMKSWVNESGRLCYRSAPRAMHRCSGAEFLEDLESRRMMSATDVARDRHVAAEFQRAQPLPFPSRPASITYDGRTESANRVLGKLIAWAASTKQQIHSVSILSHGSAGRFALGKDWITDKSVQDKSWARLKNVLADDASIYVFGCNVAQDKSGGNLLNHLATVSGADVYGSTNLTGKGGDWILEASSKNAPQHDATPLVGKSLLSWDASLAAIQVTQNSSTTTEAGGQATFDVVLDTSTDGRCRHPDQQHGHQRRNGLGRGAHLHHRQLGPAADGDRHRRERRHRRQRRELRCRDRPGVEPRPRLRHPDLAEPDVHEPGQRHRGFSITPTSGLTTTEAGGQATFDVVLTSEPTDDVTITITSNDLTEGTVNFASLTFTPGNWDTPQTVTITGLQDYTNDGNVGFTIVTGRRAAAIRSTQHESVGRVVSPTIRWRTSRRSTACPARSRRTKTRTSSSRPATAT
jgi:hypothetical protein